MKWPWARAKVETRSSYTDAVVQAILAQVGGTSGALAQSTAAVEACAGFYAAGFATAKVEGAGASTAALDAAFMSRIGRELIWPGESLSLIEVRSGRIVLIPICSYLVTGGVDPASWRYLVDLAAPSGMESRRVPAGAVLHLRYSVSAAYPWQGIGPVQQAPISARLLAEIETATADEAAGTRGHIIPVPNDGDDDELAGLKTTVAGLRGKTALIETTANAWGGARNDAPKSDWTPKRLGFAATASQIQACSNAALSIFNACRLPAALMIASSDGTAAREAFRRWSHVGLAALGALAQSELRASLNAPGLTLSFEALMASDITGRARAFASMVKAGMDPSKAAALTGLLSADD